MSKNDNAMKALESLRNRLLDLTTRNRLISYRHTKGRSLRVIDELPDQLAQTLLADTEMRFRSINEPSQEELLQAGCIEIDESTGQAVQIKKYPTAEEWARSLGFSTDWEVPVPRLGEQASKHEDRDIQTLLYPHELATSLRTLHQNAELAIQEMGANILYMVFGFLEWYEHSQDKARLAPLYLEPVRLHRGRLDPSTRSYAYTLEYSGKDILTNLSLREKHRVDFGMALPELDENTAPESYFAAVADLIEKNQPEWQVRRYVSLTLLNFGKLLMYLDLDPTRWPDEANIVNHPVVKRFLAGC